MWKPRRLTTLWTSISIAIPLYTCIRNATGFKLSQDTGYSDWRFSWISSVLTCKCVNAPVQMAMDWSEKLELLPSLMSTSPRALSLDPRALHSRDGPSGHQTGGYVGAQRLSGHCAALDLLSCPTPAVTIATKLWRGWELQQTADGQTHWPPCPASPSRSIHAVNDPSDVTGSLCDSTKT